MSTCRVRRLAPLRFTIPSAAGLSVREAIVPTESPHISCSNGLAWQFPRTRHPPVPSLRTHQNPNRPAICYLGQCYSGQMLLRPMLLWPIVTSANFSTMAENKKAIFMLRPTDNLDMKTNFLGRIVVLANFPGQFVTGAMFFSAVATQAKWCSGQISGSICCLDHLFQATGHSGQMLLRPTFQDNLLFRTNVLDQWPPRPNYLHPGRPCPGPPTPDSQARTPPDPDPLAPDPLPRTPQPRTPLAPDLLPHQKFRTFFPLPTLFFCPAKKKEHQSPVTFNRLWNPSHPVSSPEMR